MTMLAVRQSNLFFMPQMPAFHRLEKSSAYRENGTESKDAPLLESILAGSKVGVWTLDLFGKRISLCDTARAFMGIRSKAEVRIFNLLERIRSEDRQAVMHLFRSVCQSGQRAEFVFRTVISHGEPDQWLQLTAGQYPASSANGQQLIAGTLIDVTAQKQAQIEKEDCMSMLSHELRSPLTTIKLYVQMLRKQARDEGNAPLAELLERADGQATSMGRLIDSFLAMSVAEHTAMELCKTHFDISELISEVTGEMKLRFPDYRFLLKTNGLAKIAADRDKVIQVLVNYISNAVKYAREGSLVTIHCELQGEAIFVSVKDEGPGISEQDQQNLFKKFYRTRTTQVSGFGLGLYLVKKIIEAHEGRVGVQSSPGIGSTFSFELPVYR